MKLGVALLLGAACFAQQPFEIHGVVTEPGVGPISGVEIAAESQNEQGPGAPFVRVVSVFTDARGEFVLRPSAEGAYRVVPAPGAYVPVDPVLVGARVDAAHPRAEVNFALQRLGEINGRVVDADTLAPLSGVRLIAMARRPSWTMTGPAPPAERSSGEALAQLEVSGPDGTFTLTRRRPGDYAITAANDRPTLTLGYAPEALEVIEQAYPPLYWPGGVPLQDAVPMTLRSGGVISVGSIRIKKTPAYRIHVAIPQGDCPEGESVRVTLFGRLDRPLDAVAPCGSDLLATNLQLGSYVLYAVSDWQGQRDNVENAVWATTQIVIEGKNVETVLDLRRGIVIEGRVTSAEGSPAIPGDYSIATLPDPLIPGLPSPPPEQFITFGENGRFRIAAGPHPQTLVFGRRGVYIKEARYNGAPVQDLKLPLNSGATANSLELILDDKFGTVRGEVTGSGVVVLQPEGSIPGRYIAPVSNGTYVSPPLVPGRYRVALLPTDPRVLEGASPDLTNAQTITVRPGATETLNLRASSSR